MPNKDNVATFTAAELTKAIEDNSKPLEREIEYVPRGMETGFVVKVRYTPGRAWRKLSNRVKAMGGNDRAKEFAITKGEEALVAKAIIGWEEMLPEHFLAMLDVSEDMIPEGTKRVGHNEDMALVLVRECGDFKLFVFDQISELQGFREEARAEAQKN